MLRPNRLFTRTLLAAAVSCVLLPGSLRAANSYINFGPADSIAMDQPRAWAFAFTEPDTDNIIGITNSNGLLDTGANGVVLAATCFYDEEGIPNANLYRIQQMPAVYAADGKTVLIPAHPVEFLELGVSGYQYFDVYEAHDLVINTSFSLDEGAEPPTLARVSNIRAMGSPSLMADNWFAPAAIIGMPAMVGNYVHFNVQPMASGDFLHTTILDPAGGRPASTATSHKVRLTRLPAAPEAGQVYPNDPLPTYADLPMVADVVTGEGNKTSTDTMLLDTGAALSMISTATATRLGLQMDTGGNGTDVYDYRKLDTNVIGYLAIGGIGGEIYAPVVMLDYVSIPTKDGVDLVMTDLIVAVVDIPGLGGIFGMNMLMGGVSSTWGTGNPGYLDSVLLDFTGDTEWEMEWNVNAASHNISNGSYSRPPKTLKWSGMGEREVLKSPEDPTYWDNPVLALADVTWNTSRPGQNWVDPSITDPSVAQVLRFRNGDHVIFDDSAAAGWDPEQRPESPFVIDVVTAVAPGSILVNNPTRDYTFKNTSGFGRITGTTGLTKRGAAKLIMQISNDYKGLTDIEAGEIVFAAPQNIGTVKVRTGAKATIQTSQRFAALDLSGGNVNLTAGGAKLLDVDQLTYSSGQLDLADNALRVRNGDLSAVNTLVGNGYKGVGYGGAGDKTWKGQGIITSVAVPSGTTLGVIKSGTDVLVKYAYFGDVNLDGVVNGTDFIVMTNGYSAAQQGTLPHGGGTAWSDGDINYDGVINGTDFIIATQGYSYAQQNGPMSTTLNIVMPEPTALGLLGIGAIGLLARRRSRR